jgi:hypothetical protein
MRALGSSHMLAAAQGGTPVWLTPLIAAGAAIIAAAFTAFASAYVARRKVAELQLSNTFELAKQYLESARSYTQAVYLPLAIAVYGLHSEYLKFKAAAEGQEKLAERAFRTECENFISTIDALFRQGATAVLTLRLDETVTRFVSLLRESLSAHQVIKDTSTFKSAMRAFGRTMTAFFSGVTLTVSIPGVAVVSGLELPLRGLGTVIAAAPITSPEFDESFLLYINSIKAGIKEVTLGGYKDTDT